MFATIGPTFGIQDEKERIAARKSLVEPGGAMYNQMMVIEKLPASSKTKYYLGGMPRLADVIVFVQMCQFIGGCGPAQLLMNVMGNGGHCEQTVIKTSVLLMEN
jgi:hypothetical protein